jgi:hypothetical protein
VIVTGAPTAAEDGDRLVMLGVGSTVNAAPALDKLPTVTTTLPVVAPAATETTIDVTLQLVDVAAVPLNVTVLVPWVAPKFAPVIVTGAPAAAEVGDRPLILGVASTVKENPELASPFTVTTTLPVVASAGTEITIDVALQLVGVAAMPLKVTVLVPWVAPKFVPVIVTAAPTAPDEGDRLVIPGIGRDGLEAPLLLPLPHPDRPSVAPKAIPRQPTPALLATFMHLARRQFMESGRESRYRVRWGSMVDMGGKGNSRHLTLIVLT